MKRLGLIGLLFMLASLNFLTNGTPSLARPENTGSIESSVEKIQRFTDVLQDKGIQPDSWSIFSREKSYEMNDIQMFQKRVRQIKSELLAFQWNKISESSGYYSFTGTMIEPKNGMKVSVTLFAYPHKGLYSSYLVYEIRGNKWDKNIAASLKRQFATNMTKIQHQEMTFYTCVMAHDGATMNNGLSKTVFGVLNALEARPVEEVSEKTFISISAYTDYWKDSLTTGHKLMNVQVAMRQTGDSATLILGSPIITTAY